MHCIPGPFGNFCCREVGKKHGNPVILGTEDHNHSNVVANLNFLEMFIILGESEPGDFRQAPSTCNVLDTIQSNDTDKYNI